MVHLHCHSDFSMLDGMASVKGYAARCKELGMSAIALTDHGNMHGAIDFYRACKAEGIKPIIGCEFYHTRDRAVRNPDDKYNHLILLAMDEEGYHQLMRLNTIAWTEGKYYKPRIDDRALEEDSSHLICLSACIAGEIPKLILANKPEQARERVRWYMSVFGDRYYIELQNHGLPEEHKVMPELVRIAREFGIPVVATNDVHYINRDDSDAHDTMLCIGTQAHKYDVNRIRYKDHEFYLRSEAEMRELFRSIPEAIDNTEKVAARCNLELVLPGPILPKCPIPEGYANDSEYLTDLAYKGLSKRYPDASEEYMETLKKRLQYELDIIQRMDFPAYFLIVQDYINWAKDHGIAVGPGRGSGAGSLVAYSLRITDVDPMKYDLLFERFLNPERVSMPDFDIDFCYERRGEVIEYVSERYGSDHVAQIVTFGTLKSKVVLKDTARVFGLSVAESNNLTALIPDEIDGKKDFSLRDAIEAVPDLKAASQNPRYAEMFDHACRLEGLNRQTGIHAAGVVIGREKLDEYVPLMTDSTGATISQISSPTIEECGLVKMDFLGLKTLTLIENTVKLVKLRHPEFDMNSISDSDKATFDMLSRGDSSCVFQFESKGMQDILKRTKPSSIDDLAALNALYRPGPMQFIDKFIESKQDSSLIEYPDPCLESILKKTYGVIVYQEQVMQVAQRIAGYSLGEADNLRRIMGKKKVDKMAEELIKFRKGAVANGFTAEHAENIFHILEPFAGYGFNKAHAVAYTVVAYRTAYLKAHYPAEFLAANLTNEIGNPDKFKEYLALAGKWNLKITPPSINRSLSEFSVNGSNVIYGFSAIRNVGKDIATGIVKEREMNGDYRNMSDFIRRQEIAPNSRVMEALIKSGCFDCTGDERGALLLNCKSMLEADKRHRQEVATGQMALFGDDDIVDTPLKAAEPLSRLAMLRQEKEYLGFYVSGHPVDEYQQIVDRCVCTDLSDPSTWPIGGTTAIVAEVESCIARTSRRTGKPFAILTVSTPEGGAEWFLGEDVLMDMQSSNLLTPGSVIGVVGNWYVARDGNTKFYVKKIVSPELLPAKAASLLHLRMHTGTPKNVIEETVRHIYRTMVSNSGIAVLVSIDDDPENFMKLKFQIDPARLDLSEVRQLAGVRRAWTE